MTYCVGLMVNQGMVFLSDTRTNAGVDNISRYRKMFTWQVPGERAIVLMTAGNLAVTQAVINLLQEAIEREQAQASGSGTAEGDGADADNSPENGGSILSAPSLFRIAEMVGEAMVSVRHKYQDSLHQMADLSGASIIVGGQRAGGVPRMFLVYAEGNFIEATEDTPFLQIGEHKYGKPILDRVITMDTTLDEARKAALLSMDSTLRSNLSVGMPLDLTVLPCDTYTFSEQRRIDADDQAFHNLSEAWSGALKIAFQTIT